MNLERCYIQTILDPNLGRFCEIVGSTYYGECRGSIKKGFEVSKAVGTIVAYDNETGWALVMLSKAG